MENVIVNAAPDAARLATAIAANDIDAVKAWVAEFGIESKVDYLVPGDSPDVTIWGTPFAIAVSQGLEGIALWLLLNGASHELYSYNSYSGHMQSHTYHPLGAATLNGLEKVAKLMLEQGVDFHVKQRVYFEDSDIPEFEEFGAAFLRYEGTLPMLARIGRLDLLALLAKEDFRTDEEKQAALELANA